MQKTYDSAGLLLHRNLINYLLMAKLTIILILCFCFQTQAINVNGQKNINLRMKDVTIESVLKKIESQGIYRFVYKNEILPQSKLVTIDARNEAISHVMNEVLQNTSLSYKIMDRNLIVILPQAVAKVIMQPVTGKVVDGEGRSIEGVSVIEKGTTNGTTSNAEGNFSIDVGENAVLVFSGVGFVTQELRASSGSFMSVVMRSSETNLDEVVVVGYGTQRRRNVTGAIGTVRIENTPLANLPNPNILDALKGRVPGFNIGAVANAGGNPSRTIRGQSSILAAQEPLVVVDGVIFTGSFNEINPSDIESVDILKDASATAIYGSQGNAGVILVTTKKGKAGKPVINGRVNMGYQTHTMPKPNMRKGEDFIQFRRDYMRLQNNKTDIPIEELLNPNELKAYNEGHTVDWWDVVVQQAPFRDYQLNISGGGERVNYYISGSYLDQKVSFTTISLKGTPYFQRSMPKSPIG